MSDFTKEELETIAYCVDETARRESTDEQVIIDKIQIMIDNYCDHDWCTDEAGIWCSKCFKKRCL